MQNKPVGEAAGPRRANALTVACNAVVVLVVLSIVPSQAGAYPLDSDAESGIRRLVGYRAAQHALWPGQTWAGSDIGLHLADYDGPDFDALPEDPQLAAFLAKNLRSRDPSYSMVLVDIADPERIRWAGLRPDLKQNAGSVGKILCMAALFHALAEAFPDPADRARVLRETESPAGRWVSNEIHKVPKWNATLGRNVHSVIVSADRFRLAEWLDHAISASANGAGSIVWREAMLIREFGTAYPELTDEAREDYFKTTPRAQLTRQAQALIVEPLQAAGIDTGNLQQGSFWTTTSKQIVPGTVSFATPRELARFAFRIEQGRLVDAWSSLEMKKYMYLTKRRYRYSYAPELGNSAVFFKSGSLYSCRPEEGFACGKYLGNVRNMMNSVAIVEGAAGAGPHYIATLMSNVLKFNSAWDHSRIAAAVHETLRTAKAQSLRDTASEKEMRDAGISE